MFTNYTLHILSLRLCIPDFNVPKKKHCYSSRHFRNAQRREREIDFSCTPSNNNKYKHVSYRCCSNSSLSGVSVRSCCDIGTSLHQMAGRILARLFYHWKPSQHNVLWFLESVLRYCRSISISVVRKSPTPADRPLGWRRGIRKTGINFWSSTCRC